MSAVTHMINPETRQRILSIPCVDIDTARQVALVQHNTVNIVQGGDITAGYWQGEMLFCVYTEKEAEAWLNKFISTTNDHETNNRSRTVAARQRRGRARNALST